MTARAAAAVMALLAAALYLAVAVPAGREAAEAADAFGRARLERQDAASRVAALERRREARARAVAAVSDAGGDPAASTRAVRRAVSQVIEGSRAEGVNLAIRPGVQGVEVAIAARGAADDILRLAGALARPEVGVVLGRVNLARAPGGVTVQVEGLGVARP